MAEKNLRLRTTPVFPGTRPTTDDAAAKPVYDLENRRLSDPLLELERLVGEIDSFAKTRTDAGRGSKLKNFDANRGYTEEVTSAAPRHRDDPGTRTNAAPDQPYPSLNNDAYASQSHAVEEDVDAQVDDDAEFDNDQRRESEYYDDERAYAAEADDNESQGDAYTHCADAAPGPARTQRNILMTVGAVLGLLLICAVGAYAYRLIFGGAPGVPPIVNADTSPAKIAVGSSDNAAGSLVPREEQPINPTVSTPSVEQQSSPPASAAPESSPVDSPNEPHPVQTIAVPPSVAPDESSAAATLVPAPVTADPQPASPRPAAPKVNQKIASQEEAPETSQVGQSPVGRYMIQISASATREEATAALKAAQAKYPDVLGGRQSQVREKKLADKAPLFAAQFGPFASRADAAELCQRLKSAGGSCYVP